MNVVLRDLYAVTQNNSKRQTLLLSRAGIRVKEVRHSAQVEKCKRAPKKKTKNLGINIDNILLKYFLNSNIEILKIGCSFALKTLTAP